MVFGAFKKSNTMYSLVKEDADPEGTNLYEEPPTPPPWYSKFFPVKPGMSPSRMLLLSSWLLVVVLLLSNIHLLVRVRKYGYLHVGPSALGHEPIYSPAEEAVRYHDVVYSSGFGKIEISEYQGPPSPENNQAWSDLYNFGISRIPQSAAKLIPNRTVPIPDDPGYYAVGLDVFHQLHCLNMVRLRVWATESFVPEHDLMGIEHIDHCIDTIRQSLMCASDITPLPFVWIEAEQRTMEVARVLHTCRDFEQVREWGRRHHIGPFDRTRKVDDPLDNDPEVKGVMIFE